MNYKSLMAVLALALAMMAGGLVLTAGAREEEDPEDFGHMPFMEDFGPGMGQGGSSPDGGPGMRPRGMRRGGPSAMEDDEAGPGRRGTRGRRHDRLDRIKTEDPKRYARVQKIRELSAKYRESDDEAEKKQIEKELRSLIEKELKLQHEENKRRIAIMEKRLVEARKVIEKREENWDKVVDYTVKEATGQNDYLRAWRERGGMGPPRRR